jgi:signal recognition particle receptor subunit beta
MALFNYATKEITIKIVYYGPGLSGKTTNLQYLHSVLDPDTKGKLLSLATEADRTLFFDFLPLELGKIREFSIRFQLYTVPGQVRYNATRKLVLRGADAVVFVADSQRDMREQNIESLQNMYENLFANNINPEETPVILQYNKRDLPNILSIDDLNGDLNKNGRYEYTESTALDGIGVENTFQHITKLVLKGIAEKHKVTVSPPEVLHDTVVEEKEPHMEPSEELREKIETKEPYMEIAEDLPETVEAKEPYIELAEDLPETVEEKEPYDEGTIVMQEPNDAEIMTKLTSEEIFPAPPSEEFEAPTPESIMYRTPEEDESLYEPTTEEKPVQEEPVQRVLEEKLSHLEEVLMKEINESLRKQEENIVKIMNNISDISNALSVTKNEVSKLQSEIRDMKKEQKDTYAVLKELRHTLENMKEKKTWFRLS